MMLVEKTKTKENTKAHVNFTIEVNDIHDIIHKST